MTSPRPSPSRSIPSLLALRLALVVCAVVAGCSTATQTQVSRTTPIAASDGTEASLWVRTASPEASPDIVLEATSTASVGPVTISLLDHHREPIASVTRELHGTLSKPATALFVFHDFDVRVEGISVTTAGEQRLVDTEVEQHELEAGDRHWRLGLGKLATPRRNVAGR